MLQILFVFFLFLLTFILFEATSSVNRISKSKKITKDYLSEFSVYLCLKNRLLLYPPKEVCIENKYHVLNLSAKNNILPHKNIISKNGLAKCTECLYRCIPGIDSSDMIDLKISFSTFKNMSNDELKKHIKVILTKEQYEYLFNEETKSEASN